MSFIIIFTTYLILLVPLLGGRRIFVLLVLIELLSWILAVVIPISISLKYLIIQGYFIFLGLIGLLWYTPALVFRLLLKVGLPPFHLWFFSISFYLYKNIFTFFITIHKLIPLFLIRKVSTFIVYFIGAILVSSGVLLFQVSDFLYTFISSSLLHTGWIILAILLSNKVGLIYWLLYSLLIIIMISILVFKTIALLSLEQSSLISLSWLILSGVPPFTIFWLKLSILYLAMWFNFRIILLLILTSVLALSSYFRAFHIGIVLTAKVKALTLSLLVIISLLIIL